MDESWNYLKGAVWNCQLIIELSIEPSYRTTEGYE
jgi:hypothetical protein